MDEFLGIEWKIGDNVVITAPTVTNQEFDYGPSSTSTYVISEFTSIPAGCITGYQANLVDGIT